MGLHTEVNAQYRVPKLIKKGPKDSTFQKESCRIWSCTVHCSCLIHAFTIQASILKLHIPFLMSRKKKMSLDCKRPRWLCRRGEVVPSGSLVVWLKHSSCGLHHGPHWGFHKLWLRLGWPHFSVSMSSGAARIHWPWQDLTVRRDGVRAMAEGS